MPEISEIPQVNDRVVESHMPDIAEIKQMAASISLTRSERVLEEEGWNEDAIPAIVDSIENGVDIGAAYRMVDTLASKKSVVEIGRFLSNDRVVVSGAGWVRSGLIDLIAFQDLDISESEKDQMEEYLRKVAASLTDRMVNYISGTGIDFDDKYDFFQMKEDYLRILKLRLTICPETASVVASSLRENMFLLGREKSDEMWRILRIKGIQSPTDEEQKDYWSRGLRRLIRRAEIGRLLEQMSSAEEIKQAVRVFERELSVDEVVHGLTTKEMMVKEEVSHVAEDLSVMIMNKFEGVRGVVLMGSSVNGGGIVRGITRSQEEPDLDWGLVVSSEVEFSTIRSIVDKAKEALPELAKKYGLPETFHSCDTINPKMYWNLEIRGKQAAIDLALNHPERIPFYLEPSYPKGLTRRNTQLIIEGLNLVKRDLPSEYERVMEKIMAEWSDHHRLKIKHMEAADRPVDRKLRARVALDSAKFMSEPMERRLRGDSGV